MISISEVLDELAIILQEIEVDDNNMACVRFPVGEQTWKVSIYWDPDNEDIRLNIRRRD